MRKFGVNLVEYNIDRDSNAREEVKKMTGRTGVPVIDIEGTIIPGYNEYMIKAALDKHARSE